MKKLIGMTDYVLEQFNMLYNADITQDVYVTRTKKHCDFLKQPLEKCMFVACDEEGNILKYVKNLYEEFCDKDSVCRVISKEEIKYQQAIERVIFEGFVKCNRNSNVNCVYNEDLDLHLDTDFKFAKTIEDLVKYNLTLRK